jgi:hypothetical protein
MLVASAWSAAWLAALPPAPVRAFSDPTTFQNDIAEGGGGGRFFTGSPADGYTCKVCHSGAPSPDVHITGLPLERGYTPGTAYEVTIDWPDDLDNVALAAELTDGNGKGAGAIRLPPQNELFEPERCVPVSAGLPAAMLIDAPSRTIIEVPNCGARRARFLWIAPAQGHGAVWFAGSLVHADGKNGVLGDGVTNFSTLIPSPSQRSAEVSAVTNGCSTAHVSGEGGARDVSLATLLALLTWLAHRRRRAFRCRDLKDARAVGHQAERGIAAQRRRPA